MFTELDSSRDSFRFISWCLLFHIYPVMHVLVFLNIIPALKIPSLWKEWLSG